MMENIRYYKKKSGLHYYKVTDDSEKVLHIMANLTDRDIEKVTRTENGYWSSIIEKDSFCINNIDKNDFLGYSLEQSENCSEEEFNEILAISIFGLGIYENTLSKK